MPSALRRSRHRATVTSSKRKSLWRGPAVRSPCEKARIADVQEKTRKSKTRQERAAVFFACFASGCGQRLLLIQRIEPAHRFADLLVRHVVAAAFLDHIVRRSQGDESFWQNVVCSCIDC